MSGSLIEVTIIHGERYRCDAQCGIDWSSPEVVGLAKERIKQRFGDGVTLRLIKASENKHVTLEEDALPVLAIDGQPRIRGQFDIRGLLDVIDAELEIRRGGEVHVQRGL